MNLILGGILCGSVAAIWSGAPWAVCGLEAAIFVCTAWVMVQRRAPLGVIPAMLAGMCGWGAIQLAAGWTVAPADTLEAMRYWLAAACAVYLGQLADAESFRKLVLAIGSTACLVSILWFFTAHGRLGPFVSRNHYAAFVELLLPVALLLGMRGSGYLVLAAGLLASVIAAGSRAGAALVLGEAAIVFFLCRRRGARRWIGFVACAVVFTLVGGYQFLWGRISGDPDPYAVRRELLQSTAAMVRDEPLHGFGLGAWPSAYRHYVVVDFRQPIEHSHNEWLQWAAEGGLPALALMLAVVAVAAPGAIRSVWGLGVLAVCLHSLVDYPFLPLGLAVWIFVFLGAVTRRGVSCAERVGAGTGTSCYEESLSFRRPRAPGMAARERRR